MITRIISWCEEAVLWVDHHLVERTNDSRADSYHWPAAHTSGSGCFSWFHSASTFWAFS